MKFELFDDDFDLDLPKYKEEIARFEKLVISKEDKEVWDLFVADMLKNTRNAYIIITALKVMTNIGKSENNDLALFSSLSFMPDASFIEMVASIVGKYFSKGAEFARYFGVDVKPLILHKEKAKIELKKAAEKKKKEEQEKKSDAATESEDDSEED